MELPLNYKHIEHEIDDQLQKLKMSPFSENDKVIALEFAKCVSRIHSHDLSQSKLPVYDVRWVIGLVLENESCGFKDEIISVLESMAKFECYTFGGSINIKKDKFMAWNIDNAIWQGDYKSGHIGSHVWDIAAIINHVNNPLFSDTFLDGYIRHSEKKPTLAALYANLYYVQVAEAVRSDNFENAIRTTKKITEQNTFETELIPYETIVRLKLVGY